MADRKAKFALLSFFGSEYLKKTGNKLIINKYSAAWDADALIESFGFDECKILITRYFDVSVNPSWKGFAKSADRVYTGLIDEQHDKASRQQIKRQAIEWMKNE